MAESEQSKHRWNSYPLNEIAANGEEKGTNTNKLITFFDDVNGASVAPHSLTVKHYGIGMLSSGIKLIVLGFVLFLLFGFSEYREYYEVDGIAISKVKGFFVEKPNGSAPFLQNCQGLNDTLVFDSPEYSINDDYDSFFVMTNIWITCDQSVGICGEDKDSVTGSGCVDDTDCTNGKVLRNGNGPQTGTCNGTTMTCNVLAWCPVEAESNKSTGYPNINAMDFTVLIKNTVSFPTSSSKYTRSNIYGGYEQSGLDSCAYDKDKSPGCPIFTLGQIVEMISPKQSFTELSSKGAVIDFNIKWNCILDEPWIYPTCTPVYSATRLGENSLLNGYNTRLTTNRYVTNGIQYRTLVKAYGIRVIVHINGEGGKASLGAVTKWLGNSLAYFNSATNILIVLLVYGYLTYYIEVINSKKKDDGCCNGYCSLWYITKGIIYFLLSGICCCCILLPVIFGRVKDKSKNQRGESNNSNTIKNNDCFTIDCTLLVITNFINLVWIACIAILIGIPLIVVALMIFSILVIPSGLVFLWKKCCPGNIAYRLNEVVNKVLKYELHYDTYAAKILRKTWDGIEKFPDYSKEERSVTNLNNTPEPTASHVVIQFEEIGATLACPGK